MKVVSTVSSTLGKKKSKYFPTELLLKRREMNLAENPTEWPQTWHVATVKHHGYWKRQMTEDAASWTLRQKCIFVIHASKIQEQKSSWLPQFNLTRSRLCYSARFMKRKCFYVEEQVCVFLPQCKTKQTYGCSAMLAASVSPLQFRVKYLNNHYMPHFCTDIHGLDETPWL